MATGQRRRGGGPKAVGDVLARFLRSSGLKQKLRSPEIYDCWPEVAGPEAAEHSRVVGFHGGVLHVEVDSAPWLQMLATFQKRELLRGVKTAIPGVCVKDIKFRVGSAAGPTEGEPWQSRPHPPTTPTTSRSYPA